MASQIYQFLPEVYGKSSTEALKSVLDAIGDADAEFIEQQLPDARAELFMTTATGRHLVSLASQYGFVVPRWAGLDTNGLRRLALPSIFLPKQSKDTFKKIVEAFYSRETLHPSFFSSVFEPYSLIDGDSLSFKTDSGETSITFRASQVADITSVKAGELASLINSQQSLVYADTVFDRTANAAKLRITSSSYGVEAYLRVSGGSAQNVLRFPDFKPVFGANGTVWTLTKENNKQYSDKVTFTYSSGFAPDLFLLDINDIVSIRNFVDEVDPLDPSIVLKPFSLLNGSYEVLDCGLVSPGVGYFTIRNLQFQLHPSLTFPVSYTQLSEADIAFTGYTPRTIYNNREFALITEPRIGEVVVSVPPVPPITRLYLEGSAHLHGIKVSVVGFTRYSITLNGIVDITAPGIAVFESKETIERCNDDEFFRFTGVGYSGGNTVILLPNNPNYTALMPFVTVGECTAEFTASAINDPVYLEIDSGAIEVFTRNVPHSFSPGQEIEWSGIDLSYTSPIVESVDGGYLASELNTRHIVRSVSGKYRYTVEILDSAGKPKLYTGAEIVGFDVYSLSYPVGGSDIQFKFASESDRISAGFVDGMKVRLLKYGTIYNNVMANYLRDTPLVVIRQSDDTVYLSSSRAVLFDGLVIGGGKCLRSCYVGGSAFRHIIINPYDLSPVNWNRDHWFKDALMYFLDGEIASNPSYAGSFVYDPIGIKSTVVVGGVSTTLDYNDPPINIRPFVVREKEAPGELVVTSVEGFPSQGQLMIDYGTPRSEGPFSYYSYSGTGPYRIFIDKSYVFQNTHGKNAEVRLVRSSSPYVVGETASEYPVYVTDAMSARELVSDVLGEVSASGIKITVDAQTPDLKFYEPVINPFQSTVIRG
jgi:hypothetical protein